VEDAGGDGMARVGRDPGGDGAEMVAFAARSGAGMGRGGGDQQDKAGKGAEHRRSLGGWGQSRPGALSNC